MKKFLFTLAALMSVGSALAINTINIPNQDLTEAQLGTTVTVACDAQFDNYVSAWRISFVSVPEGLTVTNLRWGKASTTNLTMYNVDGDEEQYRPQVLGEYPTWLTASMAYAYDEDGNYMGTPHWIGNLDTYLRIDFIVDANFKGGTIEYWVEPSAGGGPGYPAEECCPKNSHHDMTCTFTVPGAPQPQTLTGEIQFGEVTEAGLLPVSYNGEENVTLTATLNGEAVEIVDGNIQLVEGNNAVVVTATAEGYEALVATGEFEYTAPVIPVEVTATPTIQVQEGEEAYVITVVGDGELHLYANNVEVENPFTVARGETDVTYYFTATAQEEGKEISETAELTVVVPALVVVPPVDVPLEGDVVFGDVDPETGLLPISYDGDENVTVTVTINGEPVEIVDGNVQLVDGENEVVVTVSGEGYETLTVSENYSWTAPVTPPDPHMTGYWLVLIDAEGNLDWEPLIQGVNGDYTQTVALTYEEYGPYVANEDDSNRPWVPFYFVVNGVVYGAENDMTPTVLGNAMENPLYAESENCYSVLVGFNYTLGIAISPEGEYYVYAAQASPVVGIDELVDGKTVASVRYFNMAGQEMQEANGMTIVVTTYTDGTTSAVKVMK